MNTIKLSENIQKIKQLVRSQSTDNSVLVNWDATLKEDEAYWSLGVLYLSEIDYMDLIKFITPDSDIN